MKISKPNLNFNYRVCNLKDKSVIILEATLLLKKGNKEEIKSFFCDDIVYFFESHPAYYLESKGDSLLIKGKERLASIQEIKQMMAFSEELLRILRNKNL